MSKAWQKRSHQAKRERERHFLPERPSRHSTYTARSAAARTPGQYSARTRGTATLPSGDNQHSRNGSVGLPDLPTSVSRTDRLYQPVNSTALQQRQRAHCARSGYRSPSEEYSGTGVPALRARGTKTCNRHSTSISPASAKHPPCAESATCSCGRGRGRGQTVRPCQKESPQGWLAGRARSGSQPGLQRGSVCRRRR